MYVIIRIGDMKSLVCFQVELEIISPCYEIKMHFVHLCARGVYECVRSCAPVCLRACSSASQTSICFNVDGVLSHLRAKLKHIG